MKKHFLYLILLSTALYVLCLLWLDVVYYKFIAITVNWLKIFIPNMLTFLQVGEQGHYNLQITINFKYFSVQPLYIVCLPVVILVAWQIYVFFRMPFKKALLSLLINYATFHVLLVADLMAAPFVAVSSLALYFYSTATANLSIVVIILIFKDMWRMRNQSL